MFERVWAAAGATPMHAPRERRNAPHASENVPSHPRRQDMKSQQLIAHQFDLVYRMIADNVEGMTAEQSLAQPSPGGNCANWILGHLTNVQNNVMKLAGQEPVWESPQLSNAGWEPITSQVKAIPWETMRDRILDSRERCVAGISTLSDEKMADEVPHPFGGTT